VETTITLLIYLTGTFFVIMFATRFFNNNHYGPKDIDAKNALSKDPKLEPALPKYVTEKSRYHVYHSTFVISTVILYYLISLIFPSLISNIVEGEFATSDRFALVIGTLAFINLSTRIPFIKKTLTDWKDDLHNRAQIPDKAMHVFDSLRFSELNHSSEAFKNNVHAILNLKKDGNLRSDIDKTYFEFDKDRIEYKWSRLVYLMHVVEKWMNNEQFKRHLKSDSLKWLYLYSYYRDNLIPNMEKYKQCKLDEETTITTKNEIDVFLIKIYWLITLLLFMANKAAEDPCIHLKRTGWRIEPEYYFEFSTKQIVFTGFTIFLSILTGAAIGSLLLFSISKVEMQYLTIDPTRISYWLMYGIPMFVIPLVVTMFSKRYLSMSGVWSIQRPESSKVPYEERPWDIYFYVSLLSYLATFAILSGIYILVSLTTDPSEQGAIPKIAAYCSLAIITSGFISYLIDTPAPGWETSLRYYLSSFLPALLQGLLNVVLIAFTFLLFSDINSFNILALKPPELGKLIIYSVIGFVVGVFIYLTSRIGTKSYERRTNPKERSSEGWLTIYLDSVDKRVQTINASDSGMQIKADDELKELAKIGDPVDIYDGKFTLRGNIEEIDDKSISISIPA
jgi:hypothetical protein